MKKVVRRDYNNKTSVKLDNNSVLVTADNMRNTLALPDAYFGYVETSIPAHCARAEHDANQAHAEEVFSELAKRNVVAPIDGDKQATYHGRNDDYITRKVVKNYATNPTVSEGKEMKIRVNNVNEALSDYTAQEIKTAKELFKQCEPAEARRRYEAEAVKYAMTHPYDVEAAAKLAKKDVTRDPGESTEDYENRVRDFAARHKAKYNIAVAKQKMAEEGIKSSKDLEREPSDEELEQMLAHAKEMQAMYPEEYPDEESRKKYDLPNNFWNYLNDLIFGSYSGNGSKLPIYTDLPGTAYNIADNSGWAKNDYDIIVKFPDAQRNDKSEERVLKVAEIFNLDTARISDKQGNPCIEVKVPKYIAEIPFKIIKKVLDATQNFTIASTKITFPKEDEEDYKEAIIDVACYDVIDEQEETAGKKEKPTGNLIYTIEKV